MSIAVKTKLVIRTGLLIIAVQLLSGVTKVEKYKTTIVDLNKHELTLHWKNEKGEPYKSLFAIKKALEDRKQNILALTNAGIYGKDYAPLGLHIENRTVLRKLNKAKGGGNFFLKPNSVFLIDAKGPKIVRTEELKKTDGIILATQSGPLLFDQKGIHPKFKKDSKSKYLRNAIGIRKDGKVVLALSRIPVTFWELSSYMKDEMECETAMYLDGAISQMWRKGEPVPYVFAPFVGILAVTEKQREKQPEKSNQEKK